MNVRKIALRALSEIGGNKSIEQLVLYLQSCDRSLREDVISVLGSLKSTRAVDSLICILKEQNVDKNTLKVTVEALGKIGDSVAVSSLLEVFKIAKNAGDSWLRASAADALGNIGALSAAGPLIESCSGEFKYRYADAARALRNIFINNNKNSAASYIENVLLEWEKDIEKHNDDESASDYFNKW